MIMMNSKDFYIDQYKQYHQNENVYPGDMQYDVKFISQMIKDYSASTLLDFGCGKGHQYSREKIHEKHFNNILPALYDPGVPRYSEMPKEKFDGVMCCDVMEHVPEDAVTEVLSQIYSKANKFVFIAASDIPAYAILPNGENAHVTQKPCDWWIEKIKPFANIPTKFVIRGNDRFIVDILSKDIISKTAF